MHLQRRLTSCPYWKCVPRPIRNTRRAIAITRRPIGNTRRATAQRHDRRTGFARGIRIHRWFPVAFAVGSRGRASKSLRTSGGDPGHSLASVRRERLWDFRILTNVTGPPKCHYRSAPRRSRLDSGPHHHRKGELRGWREIAPAASPAIVPLLEMRSQTD